jgi:hypothetical protein
MGITFSQTWRADRTRIGPLGHDDNRIRWSLAARLGGACRLRMEVPGQAPAALDFARPEAPCNGLDMDLVGQSTETNRTNHNGCSTPWGGAGERRRSLADINGGNPIEVANRLMAVRQEA